jgi:hypothetical protein
VNIPTLDEMDDAIEGLLELFEEEDSESLADIIKASFGGDRRRQGVTPLNKDGKGIRRRRMMRRVVRVAVRWMMRFGVCLVC